MRPRISVRRQKGESGFTLVEIMIALGIFMMIILAIYSTWSAVLRGSKTGLEAAATAQRSRVAIHAVEDALTCATMFSANPAYYSFLADTDPGEFSSLTFTSHLPMSFPGAGLFGDQAVRRVSFYVEPDPIYRKRLAMMQVPLLEEASDHPEGYHLVLARGVKVFLLEYWDLRQGQWVTDPPPPTNQLPPMVRITLSSSTSTDGSAPPETVTRIVRIASAAVAPSMQAPLLPPGVAPVPGAGSFIPGPGGGNVIGGQVPLPPPGAPGVISPQSLEPEAIPGKGAGPAPPGGGAGTWTAANPKAEAA